jgi:hypothetical protein
MSASASITATPPRTRVVAGLFNVRTPPSPGCRSPTSWRGRLIEKVTGQTYEMAIKRLNLGQEAAGTAGSPRGAAAAEPVRGQNVQVGAVTSLGCCPALNPQS